MSQDRRATLKSLLSSTARAASQQPPAVLQHSLMHHMVWAMGWVQLFSQHSKVPRWWAHT